MVIAMKVINEMYQKGEYSSFTISSDTHTSVTLSSGRVNIPGGLSVVHVQVQFHLLETGQKHHQHQLLQLTWGCHHNVLRSYSWRDCCERWPVCSAISFSGTPAWNIAVAPPALRLWFVRGFLIPASWQVVFTRLSRNCCCMNQWNTTVPTS